ncbi:MAG: FAD-dependent oxidoreductase [Acetobacteraceae bacterium]
MTPYANLFSPLQLRHLTLRNRVFSSGHGTGFGVGGVVGDRHIAYHRARAHGGLALIVTEATGIDDAPLRSYNIRNTSDAILPGYRRLADAVHDEGAAVFALLSHTGRNQVMDADGNPPRAATEVPMDRTRDVPHRLDPDEIEGVIAAFAAAASRVRAGGLDGVALSFTHGNLAQEFLSPWSNDRDDDWGGDEERRLRFPRRVLEACRAAVGPDFILGIRYTADELVPGGYTLEDGIRYAKLFVEWGALDFIDVSAGTNANMWSRSIHYPVISSPKRPLVHLAAAVKAAVSVPVFCVAKIATPEEADAIVAAGEADMVAMTRAHIAEPALLEKIRRGANDDVRVCIYCNESCFGRQQRFGDISCVYNPRSGREHLWPPLTRAARRRRVMVIGGGPAGMEAARVAAKRGHHVTLHERLDRLGGQVPLLARTPTREAYAQITDWQEHQVRKHGVEVRLNSAPAAATILADEPDAVIVATGTRDARPAVDGADRPHVFTARQVLSGANLGRRVVVGDWDGKHMGISVAEYLAARGHAVELVSAAFYIGMDADLLTWRPAIERLQNLGVVLTPLEEFLRIDDGVVVTRRINHTSREIATDSVVLCHRGHADRHLYTELKGHVATLHAIGDCWAPRQLEQAIYEGAKVARGLWEQTS